MARPIESSKIVSSLPAKIEQENNPMPPMAAAPAELNPTRPGIPPVGERHFKSAAIPSDNTQLPIDEKSYKPATVDAAEAAPAKAEPPLPAPEAAPAAPNDSPKISPAQGEYTVVKVYYGTDRAELNNLEPKQPVYLTWLIRTIVAAAVALFLSVLGFRLFPSRLIRVLAYSGMFATGVLAGLTIYARFQAPLPCDLAKTSPSASVSYGPQRGNLELGACEVSIPKSHEVGELESPSVLRLEFREDPSRHVVLLGVQPEPAERFFTDLRECVGRSSQKSAFVFVHGYNVGFEDAARRTAQIAYDLKFDGAPIFFSWPSQAEILQYTVDETNVTWTAPHLLRFLTDVAEQSGAERIHLIAHSMGNRALTSALRDLSLMHESSKPMFNEVVLTAPDIDAETFINDIAPAVVKTARRVTLYASSNDEALIMSKKVHGYPRAGDSGSQLVVVPGIDTVDVSAVDTSLLGHNYYGDNSSVLTDIFELLNDSKPADQRQWLHAERLGLLKYWVFQQ
jgi:esterase/lipase superfamily enzyme